MLKTPYFYLFFNDVDSEYDYYNSDGVSLFFYIRAEYGDLQSGHFSRSYFDDKSGLSLRTLSLFYG